MQEATVERIGSPVGTTILKAQISKKGMKLKAKGTPWELINVAATIIDNVAVDTQASLEDVIGALIEVLAQEET